MFSIMATPLFELSFFQADIYTIILIPLNRNNIEHSNIYSAYIFRCYDILIINPRVIIQFGIGPTMRNLFASIRL